MPIERVERFRGVCDECGLVFRPTTYGELWEDKEDLRARLAATQWEVNVRHNAVRCGPCVFRERTKKLLDGRGKTR